MEVLFNTLKRKKCIALTLYQKLLHPWFHQGNTSNCVFLLIKQQIYGMTLITQNIHVSTFSVNISRGEHHLSHYNAKETKNK